jgi:hypothetical protein
MPDSFDKENIMLDVAAGQLLKAGAKNPQETFELFSPYSLDTEIGV